MTQTHNEFSPCIGVKITLFLPCGTKEVFMFSGDVAARGQLD